MNNLPSVIAGLLRRYYSIKIQGKEFVCERVQCSVSVRNLNISFTAHNALIWATRLWCFSSTEFRNRRSSGLDQKYFEYCFRMVYVVTVIKRVHSFFVLSLSLHCRTIEYLHLCSVLRFPIPRFCFVFIP